MKMFYKKPICSWLITAYCLLSMTSALAAPFLYPGVTAPYQMVTSGDTLTVQSGTMETPSGNSTAFSINFPLTGLVGTTSTITIDAGATVSYNGSLSSANVINSSKSGGPVFTEEIINNGTIGTGTGLIAIKFVNGVGPPAANIATITNNSIINGSIFTNGLAATTLNVNGTATIASSINLTPKTGGVSTLNIGPTTTANFSLQGTLGNITATNVLNNSTLNLNFTSAQMGAFTINSGSTMNVNATLEGDTATNINNSGIINVSADINKILGAFNTSASGTTNIRQTVALNLASYTVTNPGRHNSVLTDHLNYGNATFNIAPTLTNFGIVYEGGYFQSNVYTLATSTGAMPTPTLISANTNSLFLNTDTHLITPVHSSNTTITTTINRTPFQTYATNPLAYSVGVALEYLGANNPSESTMEILNAIEASTTPAEVENGLEQLSPLVSAPLNSLEVQNRVLRQVEFRLASLRNTNGYIAGDAKNDNAIWIRGFGDHANQRAIDSISGYYATTNGIAIGFDRDLDNNYLLGIAGSYGISNVTDKVNTNSNTKVKNYQAMLYGTYNFTDTRYIDWIIGIAANNYTADRYININTLNLVARSKYSGQQFSTRAIWAKDYSYANFLQLTPMALLQYTFARQYIYDEYGAPGANLSVNRENSNIFKAGLGSKIATPIALTNSIFMPELHFMVLYNILNGNQNSFSTFAQGGTLISSNMNLPRTTLLLGAALTFVVTDSLELMFNYDYKVSDRYSDNSYFLNLKYFL